MVLNMYPCEGCSRQVIFKVCFFGILGFSDAIRWVVNCPKPDIMDCSVIPAEIKYAAGDSVNISCNEGRTLKGSERLWCQEDGTWSGDPPYCEELRCPKLPGIQGLKQSKQPSINGTISFECDEGYVMMGAPTIYCDQNGRWVPNIMPSCSVLACPKLPQIMNGSIAVEEPALIHTVAKFACHEGYILEGPSTLECGADGNWMHDMMPRCVEQAIPCKRPPQIRNGSIEMSEPAVINSVVNCRCNQGFVLIGPPSLECGVDGEWIPDVMPICEDRATKESADVLMLSVKLSVIILCICVCVLGITFAIVTYRKIQHKESIKTLNKRHCELLYPAECQAKGAVEGEVTGKRFKVKLCDRCEDDAFEGCLNSRQK